MTDIAQLKSKIAEFAGHVQSTTAVAQDPFAAFFAGFAAKPFDAIQLNGSQIIAQFGQTDDLILLAQTAIGEKPSEVTMFVCSSDHDPNQVLFCGAQAGMIIVLRTRSITIDALLHAWRSTIGAAQLTLM